MTSKEIEERLFAILQRWVQGQHRRDSDEWLRALYSAYGDRMRADNHNIWMTGSILLPLAISAFGLYASTDNMDLGRIIVLAIGSSVLIVAWLFIAENHRAFQQKSEAWMNAIQRVIDINDNTPNKAEGNRLDRLLTFQHAIQRMRWGIAVLVVMVWVVLIVIEVW